MGKTDMKDELFINQITNETMDHADSNDHQFVTSEPDLLVQYFEEKTRKEDDETSTKAKESSSSVETNLLNPHEIIKLCDEGQIPIHQAEVNSHFPFFRFRIKNKVLDFPNNWSIFNDVTKLKSNAVVAFSFNKESDRDHLYDLFSKFYPAITQLKFIVLKDSVFIVVFTRNNKYFINRFDSIWNAQFQEVSTKEATKKAA